MQLFSPQVQSPWRTQALMVLDGCHLLITVLLSTLGTQGAQESCHQHGSVWTPLEHGLRTGRGGRSTDTRVREGGPEPACWGRPGTDGRVQRREAGEPRGGGPACPEDGNPAPQGKSGSQSPELAAPDSFPEKQRAQCPRPSPGKALCTSVCGASAARGRQGSPLPTPGQS